MKILLVANYLGDEQHSMLDYAANLEQHLSAPFETVTVRPRALFGRLPVPNSSVRKWLGYIDKFVIFPIELCWRSRTAAVVHICDQGNAMYVLYPVGAPSLVTCHDVTEILRARGSFEGQHVKLTGRIFQRLNLEGLRRASRIICHSQETASLLVDLGGIPSSRIGIVKNGLKYPYQPMNPEDAWHRLAKFGISRGTRFLLHVGGNQWYKNRAGLVQIFKAIKACKDGAEFQLVMAGKPWTDDLRIAAETSGLADNFRSIENPTNEDLRALYSVAVALIFPSLEEGYGLPVAEAQACGCPVFTTDQKPMTEVGGNAARYFDPSKPDEAAATILRHINDLPRMREQGLVNARRFAPEMVSKGYAAQYLQLAALSDKGLRRI